jgi:hypothetical protein
MTGLRIVVLHPGGLAVRHGIKGQPHFLLRNENAGLLARQTKNLFVVLSL